MQKRRIVSITHYTTLYGANRSLLNLVSGSRSQFEWIVFCRKMRRSVEGGDIRIELEKLNVKCYTIPFRTDIFVKRHTLIQSGVMFFCELCFNLVMASFVAVYAKFRNVKYIHSNSSATCFGAYVSFMSNIKHIWHFREFLMEDYNYSYKFGIRYLVFWANKANKVIAISKSIFVRCVKGRLINSMATIIFNGVIFKADVPLIEEKVLGSSVKVIIVGVTHDSKNQLEAVKAIELLYRKGITVSLDIIGITTGEYYQQLTEYVRNHRLNQIINFKGHVADVKSIFGDADITLVCSKNEAMGRVTIESMAYGVPVIGWDAAGTKELIKNRYSGMLYSGNEVDLAGALEELLGNVDLYDKIRINGQKEVNDKYLIEKYNENFIKCLKK